MPKGVANGRRCREGWSLLDLGMGMAAAGSGEARRTQMIWVRHSIA